MVPSSDRKAGGIVIVAVVVADANAAAAAAVAPAILLLSFAFAVVPIDGLSQFHCTFFSRTGLASLIVAVVRNDDAGR